MIKYSISPKYGYDVDTPRYGANAQYTDIMDINEFSQHIANHGSVYGRADVQAVLIQMVDCLRELLLEGYRIKMGDLGTFYIGLKSETTATKEAFTANNITAVNTHLRLGDTFKDMIDDASFEYVLTRDEQAAALAASKQATSAGGLTASGEILSSGSEEAESAEESTEETAEEATEEATEESTEETTEE